MINVGVLVRYLKSEPLPDNRGKALLDVVAKNMADVVYNNDRDVMIVFYRPDCGHCRVIWSALCLGVITSVCL